MRDLGLGFDRDAMGSRMFAFVEELFPICRSITGDGIRETLRRIGERIPLELHEVSSGTPVFDWTIPKEWNIRDAYIEDPGGRRVVDFRDHNLHVVGYSVPVDARMPLSELREHIHTLPDRPGVIPYRTSYYNESWGFCMAHEQFEHLADGEYVVRIDSRATAATPRWPTTTCRESPLPRSSPSTCRECSGSTRTDSSSYPGRSERSAGWR
jgi:aminopeptidase-like protein